MRRRGGGRPRSLLTPSSITLVKSAANSLELRRFFSSPPSNHGDASVHVGGCLDPQRGQPSSRKTQQWESGGEQEVERIHFYKSRGQHILTNPRVLDAIVRKAGVLPTDTILEIGPGTGNLTLRLLQSAQRVVAVEIDERMVDVLHRRASQLGLADRLTVIRQDAMKALFPRFDLCVSNIPYSISSPLVAKLFFGPEKPCFRSTTLLLQKEFARRLLADPGDSEFNRLAVNVKLVATVEHIMDVSKRDFVPNPRVDSSVVKLRPRSDIPDIDFEEWWAFTLVCFVKKNKTLGAIFRQKKKILELMCRSRANMLRSGVLDIDNNGSGDESEEIQEDVSEVALFKEKIVGILKSGGYEAKRPSKLSHNELLHLLSLFNHAGIYFH